MQDNSLDRLIRRYLRVWIWSIIFGFNSAVAYNTLSSGFYGGKYNLVVSAVLVAPSAVSVILSLVSWSFLLQYLDRSLLPLISRKDAPTEDANYKLLYHSMLYTIIAIAFRLAGFLIQAVFDSLSRF